MPVPYVDRRITLHQPDGTPFEARLSGNQFHPMLTSVDGIALARRSVDGMYGPSVLETNPDSATRRLDVEGTRWRMRSRERSRALRRDRESTTAALARTSSRTVGDYVGLCLLVDFPDDPGTIDRDEVRSFCNDAGYAGFGNHGSVRDYFHDVSNERLCYTNEVSAYVRARQNRSYYTDPSIAWPDRAVELIRDALETLRAGGFDPSGLTADSGGNVHALNVLYPRDDGGEPSKGLWPHASHLVPRFELGGGRFVHDYQITNMGDELTLGTFCHENGHMICDFPDLYEDVATPKVYRGVGGYCLMGQGSNADPKNPTRICGYLKYLAGWADPVAPSATGVVSLRADSPDVFLHHRNGTEFYVIENRRRDERDAALSDQGVAIWHVDADGDNFRPHTANGRYECALIQADGLRELEGGGDAYGDPEDLFHAGWRDTFGPATTPSSAWWDGSPSGLRMRSIGSPGASIRFTV